MKFPIPIPRGLIQHQGHPPNGEQSPRGRTELHTLLKEFARLTTAFGNPFAQEFTLQLPVLTQDKESLTIHDW